MSRQPIAVTRRQFGAALAAGLGARGPCAGTPAASQAPMGQIDPLPADVLPRGVRARFLDGVNGLRMHVLEAGYESPNRPALLLIHGFPELAYSWRHLMPPLAAAGYHVAAPDMRGYGRTTPAPVDYDADLRPFGTVNRIRDMLALVSALGRRAVAAIFGHDMGSPLAGWCALARPDVFRSVVMMSAPFGGAPAFPAATAAAPAPTAAGIYDELARLSPPRKHYQRYYQTREANGEMWRPPQGLHAFLRAYYHMKSADWKQNDPRPLAARSASEWAKLPKYYIMDLDKGMADQVSGEMPTAAEIARNRWLPDAELRVYTDEFGRTGFQGGLNGYRGSPTDVDLQLFAGRTLDVPAAFISGTQDWGVYQNPGAIDRLEKNVTTNYRGTRLIEGAGHWVQQEQPEALTRLLLAFLRQEPIAPA